MDAPRKPKTLTYAAVAVLAALGGFAAIYGIGRGADNARVAVGGGPAAPAGGVATSGLSQGEMAAFVFRKEPEALAEISFVDGTGKSMSLADFKGRVVLLNLWATWCAPCRKEMPGLDRLQRQLGSDKFEVVALSVDRTGVEGARKFLDSIKIANLKLFADPAAKAGTSLRAVGMPTTLLIDAHGREIGRLVGPAEWDSADAVKLIRSVLK